MFESDAYQPGYEDGYNDALAGKPKNFTRVVKFVRKNAIDSYCKGYNEGYEKGCLMRVVRR